MEELKRVEEEELSSTDTPKKAAPVYQCISVDHMKLLLNVYCVPLQSKHSCVKKRKDNSAPKRGSVS